MCAFMYFLPRFHRYVGRIKENHRNTAAFALFLPNLDGWWLDGFIHQEGGHSIHSPAQEMKGAFGPILNRFGAAQNLCLSIYQFSWYRGRVHVNAEPKEIPYHYRKHGRTRLCHAGIQSCTQTAHHSITK